MAATGANQGTLVQPSGVESIPDECVHALFPGLLDFQGKLKMSYFEAVNVWHCQDSSVS